MKVSFICAHCGKTARKERGHLKRSASIGAPVFCDRVCFGLSRRINKTKAQRVAEKRVYDAEYRRKNKTLLKQKKAAYFQRTYDPKKAAIYRKKRMHLHVEYCRRPEYVKWKRNYDAQYRAKKYGAFSDAYTLVVQLNREIKTRSNRYEIYTQNQTLNKKQSRTRQGSEAYARDYHSGSKGQRP